MANELLMHLSRDTWFLIISNQSLLKASMQIDQWAISLHHSSKQAL